MEESYEYVNEFGRKIRDIYRKSNRELFSRAIEIKYTPTHNLLVS